MGLGSHVSQLPMSLGLVAPLDFQPTICPTVPMQCHVQPLVHAPWVYCLHVVCTACMLCALPVCMACMLWAWPGRVACMLCARPGRVACLCARGLGVWPACCARGRVKLPACCALPVRGVCMLCARPRASGSAAYACCLCEWPAAWARCWCARQPGCAASVSGQ